MRITPARLYTDPLLAWLRRKTKSLALAAVVGLVEITGPGVTPARAARPVVQAPSEPVAAAQAATIPILEPMAIGPELRAKGYHACNPPDPIGLGPYSKLKNLSMGRIAIPQRGGHTPDMGFDVLIHFHGGSAMRKTLVQVARGVAFVVIDKGIGSGAYSDAFASPEPFKELKRSIEAALREHSGDPRAHIRHLGLTSWSAGYGAINEILKRGDQGIDAVVLLDSLHASWNPAHRRDGTLSSVSRDYVAPLMNYAHRAARGEKLFILSHSEIDPVAYPSVRLSADLLLSELGLARAEQDRELGLLEQRSTARREGLHVWGFRGRDELAHCGHVSLIAQAVRDIIEPAWNTPPLDRTVPPTPAPKIGTPRRSLDSGH